MARHAQIDRTHPLLKINKRNCEWHHAPAELLEFCKFLDASSACSCCNPRSANWVISDILNVLNWPLYHHSEFSINARIFSSQGDVRDIETMIVKFSRVFQVLYFSYILLTREFGELFCSWVFKVECFTSNQGSHLDSITQGANSKMKEIAYRDRWTSTQHIFPSLILF